LRQIVIGLGGKENGVPRETGFDIAVASEAMAILAWLPTWAICGGGSEPLWWASRALASP